MKLLEAIKNVTIEDEDTIKDILFSLKNRKDDIEMKEPLTEGAYYDKWQEKLDDIENIIEELEDLQNLSEDFQKEELNRIKVAINLHQLYYGGLKRLII